MAAGAHIPLRFLRAAIKKGLSVLKGRISLNQQTAKAFEPIYCKLPHKSNPFRSALRHKINNRWYSTTARYVFGTKNTAVPRLSRGPSIRAAVGRSTAFSPFASTLRPCLTGGAFPRTANGYSIGGGARFFSHLPAAPAQVMQQVSSAMRAFLFSGKGHMNTHYTDNSKRLIGVRAQLAASLAQQNAPGAYIDFDLSPTITCISSFYAANNTLKNSNLLTSLFEDFGAMMGNYLAIKADINRLSSLGDLPISLVSGKILRIHFRGCDRDFVERLCDEVGIMRGVVHEDERFMFRALAPDIAWKDMLNLSKSLSLSSTFSENGFNHSENPYECNDSDIYSRISGSESPGGSYYVEFGDAPAIAESPAHIGSSISDHGGLEDIHRFLEECDEYRSGLSAWRQ